MSEQPKKQKRQFKRPQIPQFGGSGRGAIDGDPVALILLTYMTFILIFWLGQSSALNPINGDNGVSAQYILAYNNTKWFLALFAPLGAYLIFNTVRAKLDAEEGIEDTITE